MMRRREFIRSLLAAAAMAQTGLSAQTVVPTEARTGPPAPGPVPWMQGMDAAHLDAVKTLDPETVAQTDSVFFTPQEMATLARLSDLMMPPLRSHPGADAAGVPGFLDFFVSESSGEVQRFYREGLGWLDGESKRRNKRGFAETDKAQADALLRPYLRTWMTDHYPDEPHERFVNAVHHDIRMATTNSQAWAAAVAADNAVAKDNGERSVRKELYWSPVEPDLRRSAAPVRSGS